MTHLSALASVLTLVAVTNGHVAISKTPNKLHPVHELYVKPSVDGTTGDLYVAATEDSGAKTQWLTDQPVHFLPLHSQPSIPTTYAEESLNTKRAIASPPVQYAYTLPSSGNTETKAAPAYPYTIPATLPTSATQTEGKTDLPAAAAVPQYNPYQFFYPQMMSAYANMLNVLKDAGLSEESATSVVSQTSPMWPSSYTYPFQYVVVDPNMWAQAQAATTSTSSTTPASATANENE